LRTSGSEYVMQINDRHAPLLDSLMPSPPDLTNDQETHGEPDGPAGIVITKFADWGVGLVASVSFGASESAADKDGEWLDRDHASSAPQGPPVTAHGFSVTAPQSPPIIPPQGPPVTAHGFSVTAPQGPPVVPPKI
jgi:hypothetical protein